MRRPLVFASLLAGSLTLAAQSDANIKLPQDPKAILEMAAPFYNYDPATAKPFHLSYNYQLLDAQGNASAEGKVEFWSAPGKMSRIVWTRGNNVFSAWRSADGKILQTVKGDDITGIERHLISAVLFSLPKPEDYQSGETSLRLATIDNSGTVNLCVAMVAANASAPFQPDSLHGVGTAYCFDSQSPVLVSMLQNHTVTFSFRHIQKFLDHNIAGHIDISYTGEKKLQADLEESTEIQPDDANLTPSPDATEPPSRKLAVQSLPVTAGRGGNGIKGGVILYHVPPIYPAAARAAHISGTVSIQATIGKDGTVQNPKILSSPDDSLSQAALDAVRQWRYQPYMLNGEPVDVRTTININFTPNH